MRIAPEQRRRFEQGSIVAYFVVLLVVVTALASVCAFVSQTLSVARRHNEMVEAQALAEGGAALAAAELNLALTNAKSLALNLTNNPTGAYAKNTALSSAQSNVFERVITAPFAGRSVTARICTANASAPSSARIVATATVGRVTQSASLQLQMGFGYPAACLSVNPGTSSAGVTLATALSGNVVFNCGGDGPLVVDGGPGYAVLANGRVNYNSLVTLSPTAISMTNLNTANQVPDFTAAGSPDQLFDFNRFIAVADLTPNGPAQGGNNHFRSLGDFLSKAKQTSPANPMEGVIVVDVRANEVSRDVLVKDVPNGVNVRGTLVFNFQNTNSQAVGALDTFNNYETLNINPANLSSLNPANAATYASGYPATYSDSSKNPANIDITSKGFQNFSAEDDLPALMYNIGILVIRGNANVSGVVYTPSLMEIENKADRQTQYFKGALIAGGGVYAENVKAATSIFSADPRALDRLATSQNKGGLLKALYWQ